MSHLGVDVAAFVDGQLSGPRMTSARAHLDDCEPCQLAVRQQALLKSRMSAVGGPDLSPALRAALCGLPGAQIHEESRWSRVRRSGSVRLVSVVVGVSLAVSCIAYTIGGVGEEIGDRVTPATEAYTADFTSAAVRLSAAPADDEMTAATLERLDAQGWPCHGALAGDMVRTRAVFLDDGSVVALTYANATHKLDLFEQNGALDPEGLRGFTRRMMHNSPVWVRDGRPTVATWATDGVVYTIVTDADHDRLARAVAELPTPEPEPGPMGRIGNGFDRMATWVMPAA